MEKLELKKQIAEELKKDPHWVGDLGIKVFYKLNPNSNKSSLRDTINLSRKKQSGIIEPKIDLITKFYYNPAKKEKVLKTAKEFSDWYNSEFLVALKEMVDSKELKLKFQRKEYKSFYPDGSVVYLPGTILKDWMKKAKRISEMKRKEILEIFNDDVFPKLFKNKVEFTHLLVRGSAGVYNVEGENLPKGVTRPFMLHPIFSDLDISYELKEDANKIDFYKLLSKIKIDIFRKHKLNVDFIDLNQQIKK